MKLTEVRSRAYDKWAGPPIYDLPEDLDQGLLDTVPADEMREVSARGFGARLWNWLRAYRPEPAPAFIGPVEAPPDAGSPDERIGVCCSGGGIRSAAFNLGALQTLERRPQSGDPSELARAKYLTAVSGGSYVAAAFATVYRQWPAGHERPGPREPRHDDSDPSLFGPDAPPFYRGSPEEQYLRNRASYMAPTGSAKAILCLRLLLGLLWNLAFLESAILFFGVGAGLVYRAEFYGDLPGAHQRLSLAPPTAAWLAPSLLAGLGLFLAAILLLTRQRDDPRRVIEAWALRLLGAALAVAFVTLLAPLLIEVIRNHDLVKDETSPGTADSTAVAGWTGLATVIAGVLAQLRGKVDTPKGAIETATGARSFFAKAPARLRKLLAYAAAAIAVPALAVLGFVMPASWAVATESIETPVIVALVCGTLFVLFYFIADLTTWSLHPFYKRRLAVAFALKRVKRPGKAGDEFGRAVERDYNALPVITEADVATPDDPWPVLVVCAAANVSDFGATPPGRRVTSFTFSAGAIGGPLVGAVKPANYTEALGRKRGRHHLSLLTAVAVSGAALSPSMGKGTRWSMRALLALANVRLGVWMRNPRHVVDTKHHWWERRRPRPWYLFAELFGLNYVDGKYLYVTDGGHYENLGLVELLRRGCTEIYCFDASGGKSFDALGDAIALARSEVGVEIDINTEELRPDPETGLAKADCAVGTITYADVPGRPAPKCGRIVYVRTVLTKESRCDVHAFHEADPRFPNHSTTDQLYTDQKFEAYRTLGEGASHHALKAMAGKREHDRKRRELERVEPNGHVAQANGVTRTTRRALGWFKETVEG